MLEALEDIAFKPQFLPLRIDKERKAVMAEAQMMNTMEYRVDCQLLQYLHHENNLGCRWAVTDACTSTAGDCWHASWGNAGLQITAQRAQTGRGSWSQGTARLAAPLMRAP